MKPTYCQFDFLLNVSGLYIYQMWRHLITDDGMLCKRNLKYEQNIFVGDDRYFLI